MIPRFEYVDRVPWIIDIAGFTRISENGIKQVITLSNQPVRAWTALKEFNEQGRPYLHLYAEMEKESYLNSAVNANVLAEMLTTYFKYIDQDYRDLKKILGMDPLEVTLLKCGTFEKYEQTYGKTVRHMSPSTHDLANLLSVWQTV